MEVEIIKLQNNKNIDFNIICIIENNIKWFRATCIEKFLNHDNIRRKILDINNKKNLTDEEIIRLRYKYINNDNFKLIYKIKKSNIFICYDDLRKIICKLRNENTLLLCKYLNIDINNLYIPSVETETLNIIINCFKNEDFKREYYIKIDDDINYRVDLYFFKYNLVIECDEFNHINKDIIKEKLREERIINKLNCKFIRYNPNDISFNIYNVINDIFNFIKNYYTDKYIIALENK